VRPTAETYTEKARNEAAELAARAQDATQPLIDPDDDADPVSSRWSHSEAPLPKPSPEIHPTDDTTH
jgi:hypothetical protein